MKLTWFLLSILLLAGRGESAVAEEEKMNLEKATLAGGCFWCMQPVYDKRPGVVSTIVGYTGGTNENPTYEEVSTGRTGHAEAIEVNYDPSKISYSELLDAFWQSIDPTDPRGQFADRGSQYRTAVFYHDEEQKRLALESKEKFAQSGKFDKPIVTEIVPVSKFYPAEEHHQKYYLKQAGHYALYKEGSGRAGFLRKFWGKD
jgi:methionine-S-sulfoxide reductase